MHRIEPLIPGVRNPLDIALGWITEYKAKRDAEFAAHEADTFELAWDFEYVIAMAEAMVHAPLDARQAMAEEIVNVGREHGLCPPAALTEDLEGSEPTA